MHLHSVGTNHGISWPRSLMVSYWPGPVGLQYSPREVCTSVARGMLTDRTLPVDSMGSVVCHLCGGGTEHPDEKSGVPWSIRRYGC